MKKYNSREIKLALQSGHFGIVVHTLEDVKIITYT